MLFYRRDYSIFGFELCEFKNYIMRIIDNA